MLVPGVFFSEWYNKEKVELPEGFISSGYPFLVGMPRLRQIRVKTGRNKRVVDVVVDIDRRFKNNYRSVWWSCLNVNK